MKYRNMLVKYAAPVAAGTSTLGAAFGSFAADYSEQINGAVSDASGNQSLVIGGVITVAVIGFGVAAMLGWFHR